MTPHRAEPKPYSPTGPRFELPQVPFNSLGFDDPRAPEPSVFRVLELRGFRVQGLGVRVQPKPDNRKPLNPKHQTLTPKLKLRTCTPSRMWHNSSRPRCGELRVTALGPWALQSPTQNPKPQSLKNPKPYKQSPKSREVRRPFTLPGLRFGLFVALPWIRVLRQRNSFFQGFSEGG